MSLTIDQKNKINILLEYRDSIIANLFEVEQILKKYFPEEFEVAYQHWIPQIVTALYEEDKWLPRGEQTMQHTLTRLLDKNNESSEKGLKKYI